MESAVPLSWHALHLANARLRLRIVLQFQGLYFD